MMRQRLQGLTKPGRISRLALIILAITSLLCLSTTGLSEKTGEMPSASPVSGPANSGVLSSPQLSKPQPTPDATPWPFLRLVGVLCIGFLVSALRLARKFWRFLGLGVFVNPFAPLFLLFGMGICGATETLGSLTHIGSWAPWGSWVAFLSGPALTLAIPAIPFRNKPHKAGASPVRDLAGESSFNTLLHVIEEAIRDRILKRMQEEFLAVCHKHDWGIITRAAKRALEEEMTIGRLQTKEYEKALKAIDTFRPDLDLNKDCDNKYKALHGVVRWCSFKRLRDGLDAVAKEAES